MDSGARAVASWPASGGTSGWPGTAPAASTQPAAGVGGRPPKSKFFGRRHRAGYLRDPCEGLQGLPEAADRELLVGKHFALRQLTRKHAQQVLEEKLSAL